VNPLHKIRKFNFDNSLNFDVTSFNFGGVTRRLRTTWTPELAQDLQAFHGIDVEAELTRLLSEELTRNIDRQIINNLNQDLVSVQPLVQPTGQLFYFDFQYENTDDGSWSLENIFESSIGFKTEILPHKFI
jgi:hypothetical protein